MTPGVPVTVGFLLGQVSHLPCRNHASGKYSQDEVTFSPSANKDSSWEPGLVLSDSPIPSYSCRLFKLKRTQSLPQQSSPPFYILDKMELLQSLRAKPMQFGTSFPSCPSPFSNPRNPEKKQPAVHLPRSPSALLCSVVHGAICRLCITV